MPIVKVQPHLAVAVLVCGLTRALAADPQSPAVPPQIQSALEDVLKAQVGVLLAEKDATGRSHKRGYFSKKFRKIDDATYMASLTRQTAEEETAITERLDCTIARGRDGKWTIVKEEPKDRYDGLRRGRLRDETFFRFDSLHFEREGLKITAAGGAGYEDTFAGKTARFVISATDLKYEYTPPKSAGPYAQIWSHHRQEYPKDLVFKPESMSVFCSPAECEAIRAAFSGAQPATRDALDPALQKDYDTSIKDVESARRDNAFAGFRLMPEPDRRYWNVTLKKAGAEHYFWMNFDSFEPKEVQVHVSRLGASFTGYAPVLAYYAEETIRSGVPPHQLERREDATGLDYEMESLVGAVDLGLDDPEVLVADISFTIKTRRDLDGVRFEIGRFRPIRADTTETRNPRMTVNAVQLEDGTELMSIRTGASSGFIKLPRAVPKGESLKLRMQFENRDSIYKLTPSFSFVDRLGWLPFVSFGDMINGFDLTVRVPERYEVLGIGKEVYQRRSGGKTEARFTSASPVVFPSIVFGDYFQESSEHMPTKSDGTPIPVRISLDKISMSNWGIPVSRLKPIAGEAAIALDVYRDIFGMDYPYDKLDLVNDAFGGFYGQAPSSLVYLGSNVFMGRGAAGVAGGANLADFMRTVVAHEVGHQWWGSLIANANNGNYWFVESLAEVSAAVWLEKTQSDPVKGKQEYLRHVESWRRAVLERDMTFSVQDASVLASADPGNYQAAVYNAGPYAFHILRTTFGDEKFFALLKALATDLKGKEVVTRDLQAVTEKVIGGNMDWFFDQWIRGVGIPQYSFTYDVRRTEDGKYMVAGKIRQRVVAGTKKNVMEGVYYRGLATITVLGSQRREYPARIRVEGEETPFQFKVPEEPVEVTLNKYGEMLAHDVLVNQSW